MNKTTDQNIRKQVKKVSAGIAMLIAIYTLMLALGITLCCYLWPIWWNSVNQIDSAIGIIIITLLCLFLPAIFTFNLIAFFFNTSTNERKDRMEITSNDCPELFAILRELSAKTKCPMPKKVFLTPDVNACVFYNTAFWNIFIPVSKNLEIGAGLLSMTNIDEMRGIIAHEFGHFSQDSMKVGSAISITSQIVYNLTNGDNMWDKYVVNNRWLINSYTVLFWLILSWGTNVVRKAMVFLGKITNKAYFELSRQMEYDADHVAASVVGSPVFASSLRKIDYTSYTHSFAINMAQALYTQGRKVDDFFEFHQLVSALSAKRDRLNISANHLLNGSTVQEKERGRLIANDVWADHPTLDERIAHLPAGNEESVNFSTSTALIPKSLRKQLTQLMYQEYGTDDETNRLALIEGSELSSWADNYLSRNMLPCTFTEFLNHEIGPFSLDPSKFSQQANPFTDSNRATLKEFNTAVHDLQQLRAICDGEVEVSEVVYCGKVYGAADFNMLLEQQTLYHNSLVSQVNAIDYQVMQYTYFNLADKPDCQKVELQCYGLIFTLYEFLNQRVTQLRRILEIAMIPDTEEGVEQSINSLKEDINKFLVDGIQLMEPVVPPGTLNDYYEVANNYQQYEVNELIAAANNLTDVVTNCIQKTSIRLSSLFEMVTSEKG